MVLLEIVALHPDHLTPDELATRLEDQPDRLAILDAVDELKRCGLVRATGEVIEPTHPAACMAAILQPPALANGRSPSAACDPEPA